MRFNHISAALLAISTTSSAIGLHSAFEGLLQVTPSFSGDAITLHPGLSPDHDPNDLDHLLPSLTKNLYYSQEGHRPALHGAKHASFDATFVRNTVVLDQSSHIKSVTCDDGNIQVCFKTPHALKVAEDSWTNDFNLVTYHVGCGDEASGKRSFFHASQPMIYTDSMCAVMGIIPIEEDKALDSGVVSWGTYESPDQRKRSMSPAKGHVRVSRPPPHRKMSGYGATKIRNGTRPGNQTIVNPYVNPYGYEDITTDPEALFDFFNTTHIDISNMQEEEDYLDIMPMDGDMNEMNSTEMGGTSLSKRRTSALVERGIFTDIWDGLKSLAKKIGNFFSAVFKFVSVATRFMIDVAIVTAKLIMVPFGVPFDHSIHYDVKIDEYLRSDASVTNKPPTIFGIGNGFSLAKTVEEGVEFNVQCAKCGIHANLNVNGRLAFSIKDGVTEGYVEFVNEDQFTLDAQFGITLYGKLATKTWETPLKDRNGRQLQAIPFSPLTIPGIITLGPQASISVAFTATLEGKLELLVGGSFKIEPGYARASVADEKSNGIKGLEVKFTPVFRANGTFTATGDLGLPIALECGIDVLNGKFKKTVGLIDTPSIYIKANAASNEDGSTPCNNGVELRVGAKNRIHVAALDMWDYDLRDDILYEAGIGCVTADGWDASNVQPSNGIISDIIDNSEGGDVTNQTLKLNDVAKDLKEPRGNAAGFRLVMDSEGDSILVSGEDGGIYLVDRNDNYDLSAPWGTVNMSQNALMLDVFGRIIAYKGLTQGEFPALAEIMVVDPKQVPVDWRATSIAEMNPAPEGVKPEPKDEMLYGIPYVFAEGKRRYKRQQPPIAYPTVCRTKNGLRLYITRFLFDKNGDALLPSDATSDADVNEFYDEALGKKGIKRQDCRTIQLTSQIRR